MVKVNGYSFKRSNSAIFIFAALFNGRQLLNKRIFLIKEKILACIWKGRETGSHDSCFPSKKLQRNYGGVPTHINAIIALRTAKTL